MTRYALRFHDGTVRVKNVDDDHEVARFTAMGDREIHVFSFSPDGRFLATTNSPGFALTVWDINRNAAVFSDPGPVYGYSARFSPDSRRIALFHNNDRELKIYNLATGRLDKRWPLPAPGNLEFRPDGAQIAVVYTDAAQNACRILDAHTGQVVVSFPLPSGGNGYIAWSSDGATLAYANDDLKIYLYDTAGKRKATLEGSTFKGIVVGFHPAGTLLAGTCLEKRLRIWDAVSGRQLLSLTGGPQYPEFSRDGRIVITGETQFTRYAVDPALEYRSFTHPADRRFILITPSIRRDGRLLAVGTDGGVIFWDLASGRELLNLAIGYAPHVMFEASGDLLTTGFIGLWRWPIQLDLEKNIFRIGPPRRLEFPINGLGLDEDRSGQIVALGNGTHAQVQSGEHIFQIGPLDDCRSVAVSPDGQWLATGSYNLGAGSGGCATRHAWPICRSTIALRSSSAPMANG